MHIAGIDDIGPVTFYHGTKADLQLGDLIAASYQSNYGSRRQSNFVYLSATLGAATWGAELAVDEILDWQGHSPEQLQTMRSHLETLRQQGIEAIEE